MRFIWVLAVTAWRRRRDYFDKPLSELSLEEAAYLAALPKAPNNYHPFRKRAARWRGEMVLGRMASNGFISDYEERLARAQTLS